MLTPKPPVIAAIAVLLLFPDAAFAQARSSAGGAPASLAAPSPRLSAPTTTLRTTTPSVSPGATTPTAPSPSSGLTPLSPTPSAGLTPPGGAPATTTPTTAQPGSVAPLSPMSEPLPSQFATEQGGGAAPDLALSPGTSSAPSKPGGGGKALADCMGFWDAATHMSKVEWRAACKRSMKEFPDVKW